MITFGRAVLSTAAIAAAARIMDYPMSVWHLLGLFALSVVCGLLSPDPGRSK